MANTRKNKDFNPNNCPVTHFLNKVGGKWKIMVMYVISKNCNRFSLIQKAMPDISKQMLVNQLRELEEDNIVERVIHAEKPPRVEYRITVYGQTLMPVINVMQEWGLKDLKKKKGLL
ncbi:MAG: helix-turn-helix domain-containing protein [Ferruginibacter sp.]